MPKYSIRDLSLEGKRVFIRVDFNVPLSEAGEITDDTRIRQTLPTLELALSKGARLILASHLGRPKGMHNPKMSLRPAVTRLAKLLGRTVGFSPDCIGPDALAAAQGLKDGELLLLENLRFHPEEEANDAAFAKELAALGELYVNDAFGTAHRAHASTVGMIQHFKLAAAGLLMEKELLYLSRATSNPDRPFVALLGGAKVSDKIEVIENLLPLVDVLLIGGAMAYTFMRAQGLAVGKSMVEEDKIELAKKVLTTAASNKYNLLLPLDHVIAAKVDAASQTHVVDGIETPIPDDQMGLDIGPETIAHFSKILGSARTVVWNGPMGVFEVAPFAKGTLAMAAALTQVNGTTIVGGGDSVAAISQSGVEEKVSHVCTGGGASLEFLAGKTLPGVAALSDK